jgi:hypothetical protein
MLGLQGKINGEGTLVKGQTVSDAYLAAAMLLALPEVDWCVEKAVLKERPNISPTSIIAKCQVDWPGKSLYKLVGNINFGHDIYPTSVFE